MPGNVPPVANEREGLLGFLAQQRTVLKIAAYGLTEEQLRAAPSASALSVGGLIKHCTATERSWMATVQQRSGQDEDAYLDNFRLTPDDTLDAQGTLCPIPIVWTAERMRTLRVGQILEVLATDEAIQDDLPAWARATRHEFLGFRNEPPLYRGYVRRAHE